LTSCVHHRASLRFESCTEAALHDRRYSANLMRLVVYGRESIADLEALAVAKFSAVVDKGLEPPHFSGKPRV